MPFDRKAFRASLLIKADWFSYDWTNLITLATTKQGDAKQPLI